MREHNNSDLRQQHASVEHVISDNENVTGVRPIQKKYIQGLPGSSPLVRSGADDLNYQQKYGKGPLMERAERLRRLQELKKNMA